MALTGKIHSLETFGAVDGPGIRFVVFFQGCPLRCRFCHNPDSWDTGLGTEMTVEELVGRVRDYRPFYKNGGGVTLSGGEPLLQAEFAAALLRALKAEGIHTAIDTSGIVPLELCREAVDLADMLLLDIKTFDDSRSELVTGSGETLQRETELLRYCQAQDKPVWIRHVIVPGLTDDLEENRALAAFLKSFSCIKKIQLLPFHKLGEYKWAKEAYTLSETPVPSAEQMKELEKIFE